MAQPTDASSHLYDRSDNPMIADQQSAIVSLTDSTGGSATDTINDTTASVKDDLASLGAKIQEILVVLRNHGLIAD